MPTYRKDGDSGYKLVASACTCEAANLLKTLRTRGLREIEVALHQLVWSWRGFIFFAAAFPPRSRPRLRDAIMDASKLNLLPDGDSR